LVAQNQLEVTNNNLQNTLFQLSSGSRINSGADDPAGLSIINGLQANISALQQSSQNATDGVGQLQVADGALSQVTTLLNRAVTLATEAANGGLTPAQFSAITNEYSSITSEINRIGNATNFNGTSVFQSATVANPNQVTTTAPANVSALTTMTAGQMTTVSLGANSYTFTDNGAETNLNQVHSVTSGLTTNTAIGAAGQSLTIAGSGNSFTYTSAGTDTVGNLISDINNSGKGFEAMLDGNGDLQILDTGGSNNLVVTQGATPVGVLGGAAASTMNHTVGSTVQDLINGINGSGLGVTAGLASVTNTNQISFATSVTPTTAIGNGDTLKITAGTNSFTYTANAGNDTVQGLIDAINSSGDGFNAYLNGSTGALQIVDTNDNGNIAVQAAAGLTATVGASQNATATQLEITDPQNRGSLKVTNYDSTLGFTSAPGGNPVEGGNANSFVAPAMSGSGGASVFISDGEVTNPLYNTISVQIGLLNSSQIGSNSIALGTQNLGTATGAASALTVINNAISDVAAMRGTIGAGINRLNSATNVINTQVQNLTSAQSSMQDANVGQVVANLSKYQVLEQTGISALAQANQNEQAVLKLLQ
jgi:flagellin